MVNLLISALWFARQIKYTLFWLYLWQLKEYHVGRFLAHFRTEKGKNLLLDRLTLMKGFLLFSYFLFTREEIFQSFLITGLSIVYFIEGSKLLIDFLSRKVKSPVWTVKTIFLFLAAVFIEVSYFFLLWRIEDHLLIGILVFDLLTPLFLSLLVIFFQPLSFFWRRRIIKKAKQKRAEFPQLKVVGITGSYGKTSTKEFLSDILSEKFNVLKTHKHKNSEVGISSTILEELNSSHQIFVVEMGAYNRGGIKLLSDIAQPQIGILTGINSQHLATFGSQQTIINTKYELIESLPPDGVAIFNGENDFCRDLYRKTNHPQNKRICLVSRGKDMERRDLWIKGVEVKRESLVFRVITQRGKEIAFDLPLLGRQNLENILLAFCCARELGMSWGEIFQASKRLGPEKSAMTLSDGRKGAKIIQSTYSANSTGVKAHLDYLGVWSEKRKIIIMPCLIELGDRSASLHQELGKRIGEVCDLAIITAGEYFYHLKKGAQESGMEEGNIVLIREPSKVVKKLKKELGEDNIVLLEGRIPKIITSFLVN
ncbi:MAG: hypothetical protein GF370_04085 [Candidatus Nealsonbacteria bacterium]|nr:hypothetical protein [Candidatus Nealsonbacteria bacterium]